MEPLQDRQQAQSAKAIEAGLMGRIPAGSLAASPIQSSPVREEDKRLELITACRLMRSARL